MQNEFYDYCIYSIVAMGIIGAILFFGNVLALLLDVGWAARIMVGWIPLMGLSLLCASAFMIIFLVGMFWRENRRL